MNLQEALAGRRSIRSFKQEDVPDSIIKEILSAGILAPAPSNRQQWEVIAVNDKKIIGRLNKEAGAQDTILNCPVLFAIIVDMEFNKENYSNIQATAAAVQNMQLKAFDLGYGSCCMAGIGDPKKIKEILEIPDPWLPICYMMLGIPSEAPSPPSKKELGDIYYYNKYNGKSERMQSSVFPKDWTINQLRLHQKFVSRAYKIGIDYEFYDEEEIKNIKKIISDNISSAKKILALLSYDGTIIKNIQDLFGNKSIIDCELCDEAAEFVKAKTKNINFTTFTDRIENVEDNSVDIVIIAFALEKLPEHDSIIKEAFRVTSKGGKLIVFFKNKISMYGAMYFGITKILGIKHLEGFYVRSGPFTPLSPSYLAEKFSKMSLNKISEGGFFLFPAEIKIYNKKIDGYLKRHGKKLTIAKFALRPILSFTNFMFNITKGYTKPTLAVTRYFIFEK